MPFDHFIVSVQDFFPFAHVLTSLNLKISTMQKYIIEQAITERYVKFLTTEAKS